jgi:hypothetical protein
MINKNGGRDRSKQGTKAGQQKNSPKVFLPSRLLGKEGILSLMIDTALDSQLYCSVREDKFCFLL